MKFSPPSPASPLRRRTRIPSRPSNLTPIKMSRVTQIFPLRLCTVLDFDSKRLSSVKGRPHGCEMARTFADRLTTSPNQMSGVTQMLSPGYLVAPVGLEVEQWTSLTLSRSAPRRAAESITHAVRAVTSRVNRPQASFHSAHIIAPIKGGDSLRHLSVGTRRHDRSQCRAAYLIDDA